MSEWQPIETAPKDQYVDILAAEPNEDDPGSFMQYVCTWAPAEFLSPDKPRKKMRYGWMVLGADEMNPTHWMPLPEPPKAA